MVWSFYAAGESLGPLVRHRRDFRTGLVVLKLDELLAAKHKPISKWYPLGEKTQRSGGDGSRGSLQVIAQWRYNKDLDFEPFSVPPQCDFRTSSCVDGVFLSLIHI